MSLKFSTVILAMALSGADADLTTNVLHRLSARSKIANVASAPSALRTVDLQKISAQGPNGTKGNFYIGKISVGRPIPQELQMVFDTSSGHILLPGRDCESTACKVHKTYSPKLSETSVSVNDDGSRVKKSDKTRSVITADFVLADLGVGTTSGVLVDDHVCFGSGVGGQMCPRVAILETVKMDDVPFKAMPFDGVFGLGLEALSAGPSSNLVSRLAHDNKGKMLPQFGISLGDDGGKIFFGGHDPRVTAPIQWFLVDRPQDGYWQVRLQSVRVGNTIIDSCPHGCRAIIDSSAWHLGVQSASFPALSKALVPAASSNGECHGPDLRLDLGSTELTVKAGEYAAADCTANIDALDLPVPEFANAYVLGEMLLRNHYVAFDWETKRVGFAPAFDRAAPESHPTDEVTFV